MRIDGTTIKQERTRRAWTQADLAAKAGLDERTVQRLERTGQTSFATLQAISGAFGMDLGVLVDSVPSAAPPMSRWTAPQTSPRRTVVFKLFYALAILGIIRVALFGFGNSAVWPHWQIFFIASVAALALLVYGYQRRDLRAFAVVALASLVSLLWYLPIVLPAAVFSVATYLVLAVTPQRSVRESATPWPKDGH
jgi:transcriptional regulator with XRE-family HTH domain